MEKLKVIFVEQIEIEECKDKITFFRRLSMSQRVSQIHTANYDPSAFVFYERKHALDSAHNQNIVMFTCSW